nr:immunoglobulin heavy chain junction region [Macaca mulatta]
CTRDLRPTSAGPDYW